MELKQIDALMLKKAFIAGAKSLEAKKEWINELNVFPVPDGDTGTNMTMTIMSAAKEVAGVEEVNFENICKAISSGSLRGARGCYTFSIIKRFYKSCKIRRDSRC